MTQYNLFFTFCGAGGQAEVPNRSNPVKCANLASLLSELANNLPGGLGLKVVGLRVEEDRSTRFTEDGSGQEVRRA